MAMTFYLLPLVFTLGMLPACSKHIDEPVAFDVYNAPIAGWRKLTFLGVSTAKGLPDAKVRKLISTLQTCGQYQKVNRLNQSLPLATGDPASVHKGLRSAVQAYQDAKYVHGVLVVTPFVRAISHTKNTVSLVIAKESVDHEWYDSYGYAALPSRKLFATEEIASKLKFSSKNVEQVRSHYELGLRFVLYNKNLDKIIMDHKTTVTMELANTTPDAALGERDIEAALSEQLFNRIARQVCPKVGSVERTLQGSGTDSKADGMIAAGIDFASDDKWEKAADMWRKAVLVDKRATFAYHNLGIYYEHAGDIPAAMEEFSKAKSTKLASYTQPQYDRSLPLYRPAYDLLSLGPRVFAASGANWLSVIGGDAQSLVVGKEYSIYRMRRLATAPDFRVNGISLTETGRLRIEKSEPPFMLGHVTRFIDGAQPEVGDIVMVGSQNYK